MTKKETPPTGGEFEQFTDILSSFIDGYYCALGLEKIPAYVRGDFFQERTDAVYFYDRSQLTEGFVKALQRMLSTPRWNSWRVVIPGEKTDDVIVVYESAVVFAPRRKSLKAAIRE